jgi:hypothetical protein
MDSGETLPTMLRNLYAFFVVLYVEQEEDGSTS